MLLLGLDWGPGWLSLRESIQLLGGSRRRHPSRIRGANPKRAHIKIEEGAEEPTASVKTELEP